MGYVVGHSKSNVSKTRRRGNVTIGVDADGYDKTSVSGLYAGVAPVAGKHNIVRTFEGGDPDFYSLSNSELLNFVNGLGERNLTHKTPSQSGWAGSYSLTDNDTRTFRLTTRQDNAATTSAWRTWYWDVSDYEGQTVAISADVEFVSETNCTFSSITIGQGNTGQYTTHIAGSDAADRVTVSTKPTNSIRMEWSGSINATGIVGFTQWINNVTANGANAIIEVSNVQIEVNSHVTEYSNPDKIVTSVDQAKDYLSKRSDTFFFDDIPDDSETDGLILELDASSLSSYPETGSTWYDLSGNGNNGTLTNGPTFNSEYIDIDGSNDYIDFGEDIIISPDNQGWTAEYWFNTDSASSLQHFNSAENDEFNANWLAIYNSKLAVWNRSPGYWKYGDTVIQSNTWYQAVFVCDAGGTNYRYYINGEREGGNHVGNVWNATYSSLETRYIGRYEYNGSYSRYFNGKMAKVKMYDKALSESEINQNYYGGDIVTDGLTFAVDAGHLVSYESGSTVVYPLTGSVSGSLTNGPTFNSMNGGVLEFDGTNDRLTFPHNSEFDVSGPFTIDLWFYGGSGVDSYGGLFNKSGNGNFGNWGLYGDASNDYVRFGFVATSNSQRECNNSSYSDISTPGWYYYCGTYDGSTLRLYRNGIQITSAAVSSTHQTPGTTTTDVGFGYRPGSSAYEVNYKVGTARLYNGKALSADEVLQNYNAQKARFI